MVILQIINILLTVGLFFYIRASIARVLEEVRDKNKPYPATAQNKNVVAQKQGKGVIQFDEANPIRLDKNTKVEVEGGDSIIPPEYA